MVKIDVPEKQSGKTRRKLHYDIEVYDSVRNQKLGFLHELTKDRLIILSSLKWIPINTTSRIQIKHNNIKIDGFFFSDWKNVDINPNYFQIGFKILEISDSSKQHFLNLLHYIESSQHP